MSTRKKIARGALVALLLLIVVALVVEFFYLPSYLLGDERVTPKDSRDGEITVMSCNVRYFNPLDLGQRSWFYRAHLVTEDVAEVAPDIIGYQEVTWIHQAYLEGVMEGYDSVIAYRDDFILSEGCPIFWRTDKYTKISGGSFWISETPDEMSKIEGAEHYRVCIYVVLEDKTTGERISVFNAHLDNKGELARERGMAVVLEKMEELGEGTSILLGDMNDFPDSAPIVAASAVLTDAALAARDADEGATYHAWGEDLDHERIDYFFIGGTDVDVLEYRIINNLHGDVYASDHFPIYIRMKLG